MIRSPLPLEFESWLPAARALADDVVRHPTVEVPLALVNLEDGVQAVLAARARLDASAIADLERLRSLANAVAFAQVRLDRATAPQSVLRPMLAEAARLRRIVLGSAEILAAKGLFDAARVGGLRRHRGPLGIAGDCVMLHQLFAETPALWVGKVAFSPEDLTELGRLGSELLERLRPAGAPKVRRKAELRTAADARDRLWTLLVEAWERDLWRAGAWVFGRAVDEHVPALGARRRRKKAREPE